MTDTYTRECLIELCEKAIVPESKWDDRDSESAHRQIGEAWALLKAGCDFEILHDKDLCTNMWTIWIEVYSTGFNFFEYVDDDIKEKSLEEIREYKNSKTFYIPTKERLDERKGKDWY